MFPASRLVLVTLILGLSVAVPPARAEDQAKPATPAEQAPSQQTPAKFVQDLGEHAIKIIADKKISPDQRSDKFREILRNSFDLMTIGRFVIGRSWNRATPDQQQEYMRLFEALVVRTYGDRLTLYTGEGFRVTGSRRESDKDTIVTSEITHPDGSQPTEVDWRVRKRDDKLGVIDVMVEGVSLSVTQRQEYASVIQRNGGKIDGLLALMREQLKKPSTSTAVNNRHHG